MTLADDVWHQLPVCVLFDRAPALLQPRPLSQHKEYYFFDFIFLGLAAHLLGKDLIYSLTIQVHFCSHGSGD